MIRTHPENLGVHTGANPIFSQVLYIFRFFRNPKEYRLFNLYNHLGVEQDMEYVCLTNAQNREDGNILTEKIGILVKTPPEV